MGVAVAGGKVKTAVGETFGAFVTTLGPEQAHATRATKARMAEGRGDEE